MLLQPRALGSVIATSFWVMMAQHNVIYAMLIGVELAILLRNIGTGYLPRICCDILKCSLSAQGLASRINGNLFIPREDRIKMMSCIRLAKCW